MHSYISSLLAENAKLNIDQDIMELHDDNRTDGVPTILTDGLNELILIAKIKQPLRILEFGTAAGCSGIALLKAVPNAHLYTIEARENSFNIAKANFERFNLSDRVTQYLGDALDVIDELEGKFDLVFLDCNKSKYKDLYAKIKQIMSVGGVLFADNVLFRGYITGEVKAPHRFNTIKRTMREFLDMITKDQDMITTISDIGDGVSISYRKC